MIKKPIEEIEKMNSKQIWHYIIDITQTPICKDDRYCKKLVEIALSKARITDGEQLKIF